METFNYTINEEKLEEYALYAKDWCLINGLIFIHDEPENLIYHELVKPYPITLLPTKFPRKEFNFAVEIQSYFNELIHKIANDHEFLEKVLKNVIKVDDFTRNLWNIYETVRAEGISQPISMNILRNDMMLDKNKESKETKLSQIEINTVSASFGSSASVMYQLHKNLLKYTNNSEYIQKQVVNENILVLAQGISEGWKLYGKPNALVVFIISKKEKNLGDQKLLEYKCNELESSLRIRRFTLAQIFEKAKLVDKCLIINGEEVGLVYFRAGYSPEDYENETDWQARLLIERSLAIKSPNIQTHLAGAKRIQQALTEPNVLERFIDDGQIVNKLKSTFVDQYCFENDNFDELVQFMLENCHNFVLKPQREGGGNNIYKEDIKEFYNSLTDKKELTGYILMRLVDPYVSQNYIVKPQKRSFKKENLINELGIFGVVISDSNSMITNKTGGYLVRTKPIQVNEGGVATGYSALDTFYLE